jgi:uncharacterized repeat protein (TIGR01451 family)
MGRRAVLRRISILVAIALLGFGAVAGGAALADETIPRDTGGDPGRVPGDPPGNELPTNPELGPGDGPVDPGAGLGGGSGPVTPPVITAPPSDPPTGGGGGGGIGGGGTGTAVPGVDLEVTKTDSPDPVAAGSNLTYTVTVVNNGDTDAPNVTVFDDPADEAPVLSASASQGSCSVGGGGPSCSLGTVAGGASATATFNALVLPDTPAGTITNTAAATTTATEGTTANNEDTETTMVVTSADVAVNKSNAPNPVPTGTNLTYSIGAINLGPSDAQSAAVVDTVPTGTTFVSFSAPAGWTTTTPAVGGTGTVSATRPTFAANTTAGFTLVVHATVPSGNLINNTVTAATTTNDPVPANNTSSSQASVAGSADLSVTKTDTPDPVTAGNNLTYTITAANAGGDFANNVTLGDTLPASTTFVSLTSPGGWSCTTPAVGATGAVSCSNPSVAPAASGVFTLVVKVNSSAASGSTISNTASVSSSTFDPDATNNSATASTMVNSSADLSVTKADSPDPVTAGANLTYTITAANAGPSDAVGAQLTDGVPTGTTFVSFTAPAGWTAVTPSVGGTGGITATKNVAAGEAPAVFTLVVKVNSNVVEGGTITNLASVGATTNDTNQANNTSVASTSVDAVADVSASKADSPDPVIAGTDLTYTINVSNAGPSDSQNIAIGDDLPVGTSFVSATPSQGTCSGTGPVSCTLGTLANGGTATITITVHVGSGLSEGFQLVNNGSVAASTTDPNSPNNSFTATTTVTTSADLAVTKTSPDPVTAGTDLTYTIGVTNNGPSHTGGAVTLTDPLPAGTSFVSATPSQGTCSGTTTVTCDLGTLANGASATVTVTVHVESSVVDGISNTASVTSPTADPSSENNAATAVTDVVTSADIELAKTASPDPVTAGNELTYTITATNDGPSDAQDVTVTDPLPAGTTFVSATPSQGSCTGTTTVTCGLGTLTDGASATITLVVHVDPGTPGGTVITNTATVTSPQPEVTAATADPADANNSASVSVTVLARPEAPQSASATGSAGTATAAFAVVAVPRFTG